MDSFFSFYVLPALIILLKSVVLIVVLLIFVAYHPLCRPQDLGGGAAAPRSQRRRPVGPAAGLRRPAEIRLQGAGHPVRRQQGRVPAGAAGRRRCWRSSAWAVIPVSEGWAIANINVGILYVFAISSLEVYGVIMGGWASNSKYPFLGALRSAAQMVSYEVSIGFVIITVLLCVGSLNLTDIVLSQRDGLGTRLGLPNTFLDWHWLALFPMFIVFFISALAETNRPPFDLVEAESELVAGFMVEYSSTPFLLFLLGEYVAIVLMCALTTILFLGGWLPPFDFAPFTWVPGVIWFVLKVCFVFFMFAMVKAFVPRYRYDQLMRLGWKVFLPLSLAMVVITAAFLKLTGWHDAAGSWALIGLRRSVDFRAALASRSNCRDQARSERTAQPVRAAAGHRLLRGRCSENDHVSLPSRQIAASQGVRRRLLPVDALFLRAEGDAELSASRRGRSARASAASMRCAAIRTARSAASPASSARRSARRRRSPSRPARAAMTARAARCATTSTW